MFETGGGGGGGDLFVVDCDVLLLELVATGSVLFVDTSLEYDVEFTLRLLNDAIRVDFLAAFLSSVSLGSSSAGI